MAWEKAYVLLKKRYPGLAFLLSMESEQTPVAKPVDKTGLQNISEADLLYLFDMTLADTFFDDLMGWLNEKQERHVVLLDVGIAALEHFLTLDKAAKLLEYPRVHIRLPLTSELLEQTVIECAAQFPVEKIQLRASTVYQSQYRELLTNVETALYAHTVHEHALFQEGLYSHVFFDNFINSVTSSCDSFLVSSLRDTFKGVPAIICGAGPSLNKELAAIKKLENRALIIAAGSAVTALSQHGVNFHIAMAVDPNEEEVLRFQKALTFETVLIHSNRMHHSVLATINGSCALMQTMSNPFEVAFAKVCDDEEPLAPGFGMGAMSVTTAALEVATAMGCSRIILAGVDLAYTGDRHYTSGVVEEEKEEALARQADARCSEKRIKSCDIWGNPIYTLSKWEMESKAIAAFIKQHGKQRYLNATGGGIGIDGMDNVQLRDLDRDLDFAAVLDVSAMLHLHIQQAKRINRKKVEKLLTAWHQGAEEALVLCEAAVARLKEIGDKSGSIDGKMIYFQTCFSELAVYKTLFLEPDQAFKKLAALSILPSSMSEGEREMANRDQKELSEHWDYRLYVAKAFIKSFCNLQKQGSYATT